MLLPLSIFLPAAFYSFIHWPFGAMASGTHTSHKNYFSHYGSQIDKKKKKASVQHLLRFCLIKSNDSGKKPSGFELNSHIYKHSILNTKPTSSLPVFRVSRTGCMRKEHGFCFHVLLTSNPSSNSRSLCDPEQVPYF